MSLYFSGYCAKDGGLVLGALTPANRDVLRRALGIDDDPSDEPGFDGSDPVNQAKVEALRERIRVTLLQKSVDEWMEIFIEAGAPAAPVVLPEDLPEHPQASRHFMELHSEVTGPQKLVRPLVDLSESFVAKRSAAPSAGAHSSRVLLEIGEYEQADITALREAGIIE